MGPPSQFSRHSQAMVDTYKKTKSFADAKTKAKADSEYEAISLKVREHAIQRKIHEYDIPPAEPSRG